MIKILTGIILGFTLGALINYLADQLPRDRRLSRPRCLSCGSTIPWLRSFLVILPCANCRNGRGVRSWLVILAMIAGGVWMMVRPSQKLGGWMGLFLLSFLVLITVIDIEHRLIMHVTSLFGAILALWVGIAMHGVLSTILGGLAGFLTMLAVYLLGFLFIRLLGKIRKDEMSETEAIGFGDVNLAGIVGLTLGWPGVLAGLVLAIALAGVCSLVYLVWNVIRRSYRPNLSLPYGPFLTASLFLLLYVKPSG